jgi:hypothetical protein
MKSVFLEALGRLPDNPTVATKRPVEPIGHLALR